MRRAAAWMAIVCMTVFTAAIFNACGDSKSSGGEICNNGIDDDNDGKTDCADDECANNTACQNPDVGTPDLGTPDTLEPDTFQVPDLPTSAPAQQDVINTLKLPTSATEYALDLDGSGPKNALGGIIALLSGASGGLNLQGTLDDVLSQGTLLLLLEIYADDISNAAAATVQAHLGRDLDSDPSNNFSGNATLGISANSPTDARLAGSITASKLDAGGKLLIPLPISALPTIVTLEKARIQAEVLGTGLINGIIGGAIPQADLDNKLLPGMATLANDAVGNPSVPQATKDLILNLLDTDNDGTITSTEIKNNALIGAVLAPDVDTDNDGTADALSVGIGFTAVTCTINKGP
ncbi:MAG: hypothetical protein KC503_31195 [Myxococcales bacterium]|nr:hypothetical protein [Myxococcales bacterium]